MTTGAWDPDFLQRSPMFEPLRVHGAALRTASWPSLDELRRLLAARKPPPATHGGARVSFVLQGRRSGVFAEKYEPRIYLRGEVQVRECDWHDLLNALVWLTFPRSKAALNGRHYRALLEQQANRAPNRGPVQDAMTLFDEGGVIVAARDRKLLRLIENFSWKELFWRNRPRVMTGMRFYLFGHALYEKALRPFSGITGRGILFEVEAEFLDAPLGVQISRLDDMVAARLGDAAGLRSTRELAPVPVLGVPGWCAGNARESYYDNVDYFRRGRGG
ncbi:MAG: DUF3025 domain-containing protein [Betaproteobacteria bacterium]|nr:DUF3025 domain-containing protein [Betaproteobacteria bacterium]